MACVPEGSISGEVSPLDWQFSEEITFVGRRRVTKLKRQSETRNGDFAILRKQPSIMTSVMYVTKDMESAYFT